MTLFNPLTISFWRSRRIIRPREPVDERHGVVGTTTGKATSREPDEQTRLGQAELKGLGADRCER